MLQENIIRAWKDSEFRNSLNEQERALLPENPAGIIEMTDYQLSGAAGGKNSTYDEICYSGIIACTLPINCPPEQ